MAENITVCHEEEMVVNTHVNEVDTDEEGGLRIDESIYIPPPLKKTGELSANGSRLIITKIVNENFKSYAGIQVVGPFHKCFSAIVGPNGSGKSNVIDSMLFVFGYRASKIRSKKISVLIHNSSQHQNCNSCSVSVHFQSIIDKPGSDYEVVPSSEFVISRKAFKDNSSYYELNGKKVQFKEIGKLLRSHGVDLDHNRFLILQGEVEQIALMKPKGPNENETGMLEFLEDIIGTVRYKEPLEKLCEKVEILTERRVEKLNRVKIVEKQKAALEKPMEEAVLYLKLENSITKLYHELYSCKRSETAKRVAVQEQKTIELDKDLSSLTEEMNIIQEQKEKTSKIYAEKNKKWATLQTQEDNLKAEIELLRKKDESLHAEIAETNKRRKENLATINTEKSKLEQLKQVPLKNQKNVEECEQLIKQHVENREQAEATLATLMSGLRKKTEPLLKERSELEKELISLRKNVDEAKAAYDIQYSKLELYTSVEQKEKAKLESITSSLKNTVETLTERATQMASLKEKIPITEKNLKRTQKELQDIKDKEMKMTSQLKNLRISYEEKKSAMQASRSRNRILDALMREKRENRIPGIYGRLGDLGAIDSKYDVAISTACGPLDNIVVNTVDTAQQCITFLRQNDIGRATFIPLEKQQRYLSKCNQKIQTPENVPRLFDLIRVEDREVLPAFYYALQDTLVAHDLDQATRIAYGAKRFRVVTLKGELIELSGTMSGGGRTVFRGRMGQKVVRNEPSVADIEKLETDLNEVYEECNRLKCKQQPLENQVHDLSTLLKDMIVDRDKFNIQMETLKGQKTLLEAQLKDQTKKVAESVSDPKEIQRMTKLVEDAKQKLEKVEIESSSIERKVTNINHKIDEMSGDLVKKQQKKISDLNKLVEKIKGEVYRLQVDIKTAERNYKKTEQRIQTLENDVQAMETKLREMKKEMLELEEKWKNSLEKLEEAKEALTERNEETESVKKELNELKSQESQMKSMKIDLEQKLNDNKKQLKELQQQLSEYTQRLASLKLHVIPGENPEQLKEFSEEEIEELNDKAILAKLQNVKEKLPKEIPNMQIIEDYKEKDQLYLQRVSELESVTVERNNMRDTYENIRRRRTHEFLTGFGLITTKLKEMYQMITLGGDAELELVDSLDPFSEGIVFSVRPPKKSWKNISNLSGGEKTLSSLALVFALHHYKPTPLYFMDEIDAALDFKNVSIVGNYIKERTKDAQFIIISLRSNMFELADYLVGIYKTFNCTKSVTVDVAKYYSKNGIAPPSQLTCSRNLYHQSQNLPAGKGLTQIKENCGLQIPQTDANSSHRLDLSICSTPKKSQDINDKKSDDEEKATDKEPLRKKRKLSDIAQLSLSTD